MDRRCARIEAAGRDVSVKVLAGDIGGTKSLLAYLEVDVENRRYEIIQERRFESKKYNSLTAVVREFHGSHSSDVRAACFGVACPIIDGTCDTPNLPWHIERDLLADDIGIAHTELINDFEAIGYGIELLKREDVRELQQGRPQPESPIAVLGAGTGLGETFLLWEGERYRVHASEGGHVDFAPQSDIEIQLLQYLRRIYDHVSYERILSGPGLATIYRFLIESGNAQESPAVRSRMDKENDAALISHYALEEKDEACMRALDIFVSVYGAEAGNLALKVFAEGGVFLAGGIAPRIIEKLVDGTFISSFRRKGRYASFLENIRVSVILNSKVGLLGAALVAAYLGEELYEQPE